MQLDCASQMLLNVIAVGSCTVLHLKYFLCFLSRDDFKLEKLIYIESDMIDIFIELARNLE